MEVLFAIMGLLVGCALGMAINSISFSKSSGYGFFKLEKYPDEEDVYTINMRLLPDQKLNKKKRIILTRE